MQTDTGRQEPVANVVARIDWLHVSVQVVLLRFFVAIPRMSSQTVAAGAAAVRFLLPLLFPDRIFLVPGDAPWARAGTGASGGTRAVPRWLFPDAPTSWRHVPKSECITQTRA